jgi:predicted amidohydrolase YtcJ
MIDSSTIVVRANGRTVIPGFNDAHMHHTPDPKGIRLPFDPNLDPTREEMNELLREAVGASAEGTWIFGTLNERLINDRGFDRFAIDAIAPHHPVIFLGLTNHTNVVNTAAMHLLGISEEEPDALGGFYERVRGLRQVSGRIHEYAQWSPQRCLASMATIEEGAKSLRALSDECVRLGITTVQNMSWTPVARYLDMLKSAELPIKVRVIRFPPSGPQGRLLSEGAGIATDVGDRISLSGTKWILDGTPVERASALGRPYADDPTIQGRENFAPGEVEKMIREALVADDQLILHAIGTQTLETVIKTLEDFHPRGNWGDRGLRIEHADGLNHDQIARLRSLGVMVVQNPSHFLFANIYAPRFGTDTLYASFATLLDSGIPLGIGSDGPLNPFLGLFAAVTHPARPDEACTIEQAVVAYTAGSAAAEDKSTIKGRLIPGFEADIAILSHDIFSIDATELAETRSLLTIVDGRIVHCSDEEMLQSSDD